MGGREEIEEKKKEKHTGRCGEKAPQNNKKEKNHTTENKKTHQTKVWIEENNGMMC